MPSMTRAHFQLIADVIAETRQEFGPGAGNKDACTAMDLLAENMADKLRTTNSNFNRDRFLTACQIA